MKKNEGVGHKRDRERGKERRGEKKRKDTRQKGKAGRVIYTNEDKSLLTVALALWRLVQRRGNERKLFQKENKQYSLMLCKSLTLLETEI